jgi:hypothetical protein
MSSKRQPLRKNAKDPKKQKVENAKVEEESSSEGSDGDELNMTNKADEESDPITFDFNDMKSEYSYGIAVLLKLMFGPDQARSMSDEISNQGIIYSFYLFLHSLISIPSHSIGRDGNYM